MTGGGECQTAGLQHQSHVRCNFQGYNLAAPSHGLTDDCVCPWNATPITSNSPSSYRRQPSSARSHGASSSPYEQFGPCDDSVASSTCHTPSYDSSTRHWPRSSDGWTSYKHNFIAACYLGHLRNWLIDWKCHFCVEVVKDNHHQIKNSNITMRWDHKWPTKSTVDKQMPRGEWADK